MKRLVIVESPAKARTIGKYLGAGYTVRASQGHVRDLPARSLGVEINRDFKPTYQVIPGRKKLIEALQKEANAADEIYLAADPDREGEAICFHLKELLESKPEREGSPARSAGAQAGASVSAQPGAGDSAASPGKVKRVLFNEITPAAIRAAFEHPGAINMAKVNAQQARRILDRLVGYKVSPLLWKAVRKGLSAGRVQTVAVRMIVEREEEIRVFIPKEFWEFRAILLGRQPPAFEAKASRHRGRKFHIPNQEAADRLLQELQQAQFLVDSVQKKERKRRPVPPFTTSKLQQEAVRRLGFTVKKTMSVAQRLYEGVEVGAEGAVGLITYMRTDSTRISESALQEVRQHIADRFGDRYLPAKPVFYQSRRGAQDAHEAIRPTSVGRDPESLKPFLDRDELKLYGLIWNRFVASQMNPALFDQTDIVVKAGETEFKAVGSILRFDGFLRIYRSDEGEEGAGQEAGEGMNLPDVAAGERLQLLELLRDQKFTQPPPRFNEASLVKALEEKGIGRPSTYQQILATIQNREYVVREEARLLPTPLGEVVNDLLVKNFDIIFEYDFTANLEKELDRIEENRQDDPGNEAPAAKERWVLTLERFYRDFKEKLQAAESAFRDRRRVEVPTDQVCSKCGRTMVIKWGQYGQFLGCSGFPECSERRRLVKSGGKLVPHQEVPLDRDCPQCGSPLVRKHGRYGEFVGCSNRECRYILRETTGVKCPDCGQGELAERRTRRRRVFYGCNRYPECRFVIWQKPVPHPCPDCGSPYLLEKTTKREGTVYACPNRDCRYRAGVPEEAKTGVESKAVASTG